MKYMLKDETGTPVCDGFNIEMLFDSEEEAFQEALRLMEETGEEIETVPAPEGWHYLIENQNILDDVSEVFKTAEDCKNAAANYFCNKTAYDRKQFINNYGYFSVYNYAEGSTPVSPAYIIPLEKLIEMDKRIRWEVFKIDGIRFYFRTEAEEYLEEHPELNQRTEDYRLYAYEVEL